MARKFQGIWIPANLWLMKELTMQEKFFLVEINSLDNESGCFAGNEYFADFFKISSRRVSTVINNLIEKGFVKRELIYKKGTKSIEKRVLNICSPPYPLNVQEGIEQNFLPPIEQKFRDNNTVFNKPINNTYNKVLEYWNSNSKLKDIQKITEKRKQAINSRIKECSYDEVLEMIRNCGESSFLRGDNNKNWYATFDWCFKPNNFIKVLEGNYTSNKNSNDPDWLEEHKREQREGYTPKGIPKEWDE